MEGTQQHTAKLWQTGRTWGSFYKKLVGSQSEICSGSAVSPRPVHPSPSANWLFFLARLPQQLVLIPSLVSISRLVRKKQWICCDCLLRPILSLTKIRFVSIKKVKREKRRRRKAGEEMEENKRKRKI